MQERIDEWDDLLEFLPENWQELAKTSGALKGLRKDKSPGNLLRVMFIHFACGCSLRETALRAREKGYFSGSDVALMNRIIKSKDWLQQLCEKMFTERVPVGESSRLRIIDASDVHEPGATGSQWRIHFSMALPEARCDHFAITSFKGKNTGESLRHFPMREGDLLLADRGYSRAKDIFYAHTHGAKVCIRVNYAMLPLFEQNGPFQLVRNLKILQHEGDLSEWDVQVFDPDSKEFIPGRLCAVRKNSQAIARARKRCLAKSRSNHQQTNPKTLFVNEYVLIFTTFPKEKFPLREILRIYRLRWQIELVFKRFKSLAGLGHLPKRLDDSAKAWLYGKLLAALLTEKLIAAGSAFSPWRDAFAEQEESLAGVRFYVAGTPAGHSSADSPVDHSVRVD